MKNISRNGLNLIKNFEGLSLKAYKCPAGVLTIGYGHTKNVNVNDVITLEQANLYLLQDLKGTIFCVNEYDKIYNFTQNQFDALCSFTFNCGKGNLNKLTNKGKRTKQEISEKILLYNKANDKTLNGLVKRRKAEHDLFIMR